MKKLTELLKKCRKEHECLEIWAISYINNNEIWIDLENAQKDIRELVIRNQSQLTLSKNINLSYYNEKKHKEIIKIFWDVRYQRILIMGIVFYLDIKKKERGIKK